MEFFDGVKTYVGKDKRVIDYAVDELQARTTVDTGPVEEHIIDYPEDYIVVGYLRELHFDHVDMPYKVVDIKDFVDILEEYFPKEKRPRYPLEHLGLKVLAWDYDKKLADIGVLVDVDVNEADGDIFLVRFPEDRELIGELIGYKHIEVI